jgi:hypothetical protein
VPSSMIAMFLIYMYNSSFQVSRKPWRLLRILFSGKVAGFSSRNRGFESRRRAQLWELDTL